MTVLVEACIESVDGAVAAAEAGASRLELCAALHDDGTTPSAGMLFAVLDAVSIPVHVMIRPRAGDFRFTRTEVDVMRRDIAIARDAGASGIVTGALDARGDLDAALLASLIETAEGLPVTLHRAIDRARNVDAAVDQAVQLGFARVLTSAGAPSATEGSALLAALVERTAGRLVIVAGGRVRGGNARALVEATSVREVHLRGTNPEDVRAVVAAVARA